MQASHGKPLGACVPPGCGACSSVPSGPQDSANDTHTLPCLPQNPACVVSHPLGFSFSSSYCCCDLLSVDSPGSTWVAPTRVWPVQDLLVDTEAGAALGTTCSAWDRGRTLPCGNSFRQRRLKPGSVFAPCPFLI